MRFPTKHEVEERIDEVSLFVEAIPPLNLFTLAWNGGKLLYRKIKE